MTMQYWLLWCEDKTQTYKTSAVFHASRVMFVFTQGWFCLAEVILLGTYVCSLGILGRF